MDDGSLLIVSGPPGAGKTTVGKILASDSPRSSCIHADWFWTTIVNGHLPPWEAAADSQNQAMIRSAIAAAVRMGNAGFATVLDGIIGPWHFDLVRDELTSCSVPVSYVVLRPDGDTCLGRAKGRVAEGPEHRDALTDEVPVRHMWLKFADLGPTERHVIDSSELDPESTASAVRDRLDAGLLVFPAG